MDKVAIVTNILSPYRIPLFNQIHKMENIDLTVYLLSHNEKNRLWSIDSNTAFKCKILPDYGFDWSNSVGLICHFNPHIYSEIKKENFDLVICGGYDSLTALILLTMSKIEKIPFILWSGSTQYENRGIFRIIGKPIISLFSKHSDSFIAYGSRAKQFLISNGVAEKKIFKAYNTVDINYYKNECLRHKDKKSILLKENNIKQNKCILYVGQLTARKGLKTLLDAFKKINIDDSGIALLIVGEGGQKQKYIDYCSSNDIDNVYFLGYKAIDELPKYYSIADVFILPSLSEVWGLVINEAMACSLPIITTNYVGASEDLVLNGQNGYIVNSNDSEDLYTKIKSIITNDNLKNQMEMQSLEIINKYTLLNSANGFVDAINFTKNNH